MSIYYVGVFPYSDELYHHGVKGQKWGIRNYVDENGKLTVLGKTHYNELRGYTDTGTGSYGTGNSLSVKKIGETSLAKNSPVVAYENGKSFANQTLTDTKIRGASPGSQATTVENGKNEVQNKLGSFTVMKTNSGLSSSVIKEALEKKRAAENKAAEPKAASASQETQETKTETTKKKTTKKTSNAKKAAVEKKTSSTNKSSSNASAAKKSSKKATNKASTNNMTATKASAERSIHKVGPSTSARDLQISGTSASRKNVEDFLSRYRIKAR